MKILYLECNMGAAGDMLMAALYELCTDAQREEFLRLMHAALPHSLRIEPQPTVHCGVCGTHMAVYIKGEQEPPAHCQQGHHAHEHAHTHEHDHEHEHTHEHASLHHILGTIAAMPLPEAVKQNAQAVYTAIAHAESRVHGKPVGEVHFHEVGALDAVADVTGTCLLLHLLAPARVVASAVATGSGTVRCAHGILPVPAPATALLLEGVPVWAGPLPAPGELCTPTGAALLRTFVQQFGPMPVLRLEKTGIGMGTKEFAAANCVRAFWGEAADTAQPDAVCELRCNLDDMTAEAIGYAMQTLLEAGAPEVYITPIGMKKNRPATLLTVLCAAQEQQRFTRLLLQHTATLGVRSTLCERTILRRESVTVETVYGQIRMKCATGVGVSRAKPEYDDVSAAAKKADVPYATVAAAAMAALEAQK